MKYDHIDYVINGKSFRVKVNKFDGSLTLARYQDLVISALGKIGVSEHYISVQYGGRSGESFAEVTWEINNQKYRFRCEIFDSMTKNMGAIAQAVQDDVRHITRGIKPLFAAMKQYEALPSPEEIKVKNPYFSLSVREIRKMMQLYHPDGSTPDKEKYETLREAYDIKRNSGEQE